ncbi:PD-(D/E)XK nuclease family protein [Bifidobacterium sp. ESL0798]|uniref:PD-(D/E)XK nuclease family protein n=1 Tax=Bifidobacterium sp. ESL0798 TaxID=2983235 RepID=UPI0032AFC244
MREDEPLPWPASMSEEMAGQLRRSATLTRQMYDRLVKEAKDGNESQPESQVGGDAVALAVDRIAAELPEGQSLAERTRMLLADNDLMPSMQIVQERNAGTSNQRIASNPAKGVSGKAEFDNPVERSSEEGSRAENVNALDVEVRRRGERILAGRRQNVTSLQASAGNMSKKESRNYWRALVRPIPRVASPAAEAGTRLHAWAQRFVDAFGADEVAETPADDGISAVAGGNQSETRASLIAGLEYSERNPEANRTAADRKILTWQRRLVESRWASRRPYAAEEQIVVAIAELGNRIVNGKLDAVFYGGLDVDDPTKRFTIVDWKTGKRPTTQEDIDRKLAQLDMYRLMFSQMKNIPLDSIDATLYYLDVAREDRREEHAKPKSKLEILRELNAGIPVASDED